MFDSHCHLDASEYDVDRSQVIERAKTKGVVGILVPGWRPNEWSALRELCALDPILCCGVGIHPWYVHELEPTAREQALHEMADRASQLGAVAIGECGLDAPFVKRGGASLETQERVLEAHLELAKARRLPLILHCQNAHDRLLRILKRHGPLPAGGVMHSYSGGRELVSEYVKLGMYLSFAGIVTRENARRPREALAAVPLERLLVESDGPDQAAQDVEPRRSEPAHVELVLKAAALLRGESQQQLARITTENAHRLFGFGPAL